MDTRYVYEGEASFISDGEARLEAIRIYADGGRWELVAPLLQEGDEFLKDYLRIFELEIPAIERDLQGTGLRLLDMGDSWLFGHVDDDTVGAVPRAEIHGDTSTIRQRIAEKAATPTPIRQCPDCKGSGCGGCLWTGVSL